MSNKPKKGGIHLLDRRRRAQLEREAQALAAPALAMAAAHRSRAKEEPAQMGLFLDDDRVVEEVEWCRCQPHVKWHVVRNYTQAVELVEKWIREGVQIDRMALDYDLGESYCENPRTGETFFLWFIKRVQEEARKEGSTLKLNKHMFDADVHSQHPEGRWTLRRHVAKFLRWLERNQTDDDVPAWKLEEGEEVE